MRTPEIKLASPALFGSMTGPIKRNDMRLFCLKESKPRVTGRGDRGDNQPTEETRRAEDQASRRRGGLDIIEEAGGT